MVLLGALSSNSRTGDGDSRANDDLKLEVTDDDTSPMRPETSVIELVSQDDIMCEEATKRCELYQRTLLLVRENRFSRCSACCVVVVVFGANDQNSNLNAHLSVLRPSNVK